MERHFDGKNTGGGKESSAKEPPASVGKDKGCMEARLLVFKGDITRTAQDFHGRFFGVGNIHPLLRVIHTQRYGGQNSGKGKDRCLNSVFSAKIRDNGRRIISGRKPVKKTPSGFELRAIWLRHSIPAGKNEPVRSLSSTGVRLKNLVIINQVFKLKQMGPSVKQVLPVSLKKTACIQ
jgi:hypothetical protein